MNKVGQFEETQGYPTNNVSYLRSSSRPQKDTPQTIVMILQPELQRLLSDLETDRVEKTISATKTDKFGEAICAFANDLPNHNLPGYLVVGANDDGSRCGMQVSEQLLQTLSGFRNDGRIVPPPALTVEKFVFPDGEVAVVEVQPHFLPPVRYNGKVCIRVGPRRGTANEAEERILSEKRSAFARTFDALPCQSSTLLRRLRTLASSTPLM
ncbi:MAG: ATP-binding protein [Saprospiraceae bacterium]